MNCFIVNYNQGIIIPALLVIGVEAYSYHINFGSRRKVSVEQPIKEMPDLAFKAPT